MTRIAPKRPHREWGDFQTPLDLAMRVCAYLAESGIAPDVVIEPTFGVGNFITAALQTFPTIQRVYGVEINPDYVERVTYSVSRDKLPHQKIELHCDNVFTHSFPKNLYDAQHLMIIGNPPWVTNAEIGSLEAGNLPKKSNIKSLNGLDALTGKSNFDIGEFILIRLLDLFAHQHGTLALLCKNSVAKNFVASLRQRRYPIVNIRTLTIDAQREFAAAVDANLLVIEMGAATNEMQCSVASLEQPRVIQKTFGWIHDKFVSDIDVYESCADIDGKSSRVWRQGIKHDCASVMELDADNGTLVNGLGENVGVEEEHLYWLLKGSDLKEFLAEPPRKKVIATQTSLGDDTTQLQYIAPKLWAYLTRNASAFEKRKSSIYRDKPPFSMFGVGDYTFSPYKVAICGLYKTPRFSLVLPDEQRPILLDDTCYFLPFNHYADAVITTALLNSDIAKAFLQSIAFADSKRPFTKEILMRVDLLRLVYQISFSEIERRHPSLEGITEIDFEKYKHNLSAAVPQLHLAFPDR
ncbi:MAG: SAM-dependent methyltransferase [Chloroflexi bacterium]|nr:SAM-dependent methyltransferase [Chloroflexota bacterium]